MTIQQPIPVPPEATAAEAPSRVTPMMEQYLEIKAAHPGLLLFYRMGDFYELFFEDAEIASRTLGIVLTKRGKHQGMDIPMCGVPVERSEDYLHRLIGAGHRVAVCEQTENPAEAKARGNKSVVRRGVVRLVTPGTLTEDTLLDARTNNYLIAIARARGSAGADRLGLAWIDISTSEFMVTECSPAELAATLARINPNEAIVTDALYSDSELAPTLRELPSVTPLTRDVFDSATAERRLCDYFAVATMDGLSAMSRLEATAAAAAVTYIDRTQVGKRPPLSPPAREAAGTTMAIDPATRANLELTRTLAGERRGSLLDAIDCTVTAAGSRLLAQRLAAPLTDVAVIARRLDAVSAFVEDSAAREDIRTVLRAAPDMSRALARLSVGRGGPRDLANLRDGILAADQALELLAQLSNPPAEVSTVMAALQRPSRDLAQEFSRALSEQLPLIKRDGGFVREGYEAALDESRNLRDASRLVVAAMQARYRRGHRHQDAEDPAQQCARIFRRGHRAARRQAVRAAAECDLHPSPDAGRAGPLHHRRARRDRSQDRQCRRARAQSRTRDLRAAQRNGARRQRRSAQRRACLCDARRRDVIGQTCDRRQLRAARR
ncbi:DNA mismatch repair ATPase MutS [Bradyrhizobium sp. USDA 3262]